jgi:ATP-dependent DNA ligase
MKNIISKYKTKVLSRFIPVAPEQIGAKIMEAAYYLTSVKYDGHFGALEIIKGKGTLYSRNGTLLKVPAITDAVINFSEDVILAGEICCFIDGKSSSHREVDAALANPAKHDIRFAAFDIIEYKGTVPPEDPRERNEIIQKLTRAGAIFPVEQKDYESRKDVAAFYKELSETVEGVVVRSSNGIIYKIKPSITLDLVVLGYAESPGEGQGILRELLLGLACDDVTYQLLTKCGIGFSVEERKSLVEKLEPVSVQSNYTEVSGAKTAFTMVAPQLVVEISCIDLINETTTGPVRKMKLVYDKKNGYLSQGPQYTISCISPVFLRLRKDKAADIKDAGENQVFNIIRPALEKIPDETLKPSSILKKEVFIKKGKEGTAVRKFTGLRTDKDETGLYPPFLVVYTDYSPGRKNPIEQELFLCKSEEDMLAKIENLKAENIKKGWDPIKM